MDREKLRKQLSSGEISFRDSIKTVKTGKLADKITFDLKHGWDIQYANDCDLQWTGFYTELFNNLEKQNLSPDKITKVLDSLSTQDKHWDWFNKACNYVSDEYEWFFLIAEDKPQGVCVIFHPKPSKLTSGDIFYIEYLAVAPWNRTSLINKKRFSGVGTILLKYAIEFAIKVLNLKPGFSLHSLEQAEGYYLKIGMTPIPSEDKPFLKFFEMDEKTAEGMVSI